MERDKFLKLEKTIKQMNKTEPLGKDIKDMSYEELERLEQDLKDNYRPIPVSEQYGISDRDFI